MKIQKITIVPASLEVDKSEIEPIRQKLIKDYSGKVYFETTGEVVADCVIEKELKEKISIDKFKEMKGKRV